MYTRDKNFIPDGWEVEKLGKLCKTFSGGTPSIDKPEYYNGNIPFIRSGEIHSNETELFLTDLGLKNSSAKIIEKGDLLVALYGATSGEVSISKISGAINQALLCIKSNKFDNVYLKHLLLNKKAKIINKYLQGGQGNLSAEIIKSIKFAVPPLSEQKKIAEILSAWDKVIELLDRKIDLKSQQKKYLMQILLTGDIRLSDFTAPWRKAEFDELLNYEQPNKYLVNNILTYDINKIPVLTANKSFIIGSTDDNNGVYNNGAVIIFDDFTTDSKFINFPFKIKSSAIKLLTPKKEIQLKFIYERMKLINYSAGGHKRHWISEYSNIPISIPCIKEQEKIAEILTLADDEISLLQKKRELIKQQKKYLMQTLLTGQIRVSV